MGLRNYLSKWKNIGFELTETDYSDESQTPQIIYENGSTFLADITNYDIELGGAKSLKPPVVVKTMNNEQRIALRVERHLASLLMGTVFPPFLPFTWGGLYLGEEFANRVFHTPIMISIIMCLIVFPILPAILLGVCTLSIKQLSSIVEQSKYLQTVDGIPHQIVDSPKREFDGIEFRKLPDYEVGAYYEGEFLSTWETGIIKPPGEYRVVDVRFNNYIYGTQIYKFAYFIAQINPVF